MDKFTQIKVFVRIAERGSFSAVGRDLRITQSAVSKAMTALERGLGVQLVRRSTRSVALTEAGVRYYERCRLILADLAEADALAAGLAHDIAGALKVAVPVPFGLMFVAPRMARFQSLPPSLEIELDLNDRPLNLVEENIDVAIRLGQLKNPGLVMRKLGDSPFVTVASPVYLSRCGTPVCPADLSAHNCLIYTYQAHPSAWLAEGADASSSVAVTGNYRSNNLLALKDAALAGIGIARLPWWMVDAEIQAGGLRPVLDGFRPPMFGIYAVFPSARRIPHKVKLFVDFMQDELDVVPYFVTSAAG